MKTAALTAFVATSLALRAHAYLDVEDGALNVRHFHMVERSENGEIIGRAFKNTYDIVRRDEGGLEARGRCTTVLACGTPGGCAMMAGQRYCEGESWEKSFQKAVSQTGANGATGLKIMAEGIGRGPVGTIIGAVKATTKAVLEAKEEQKKNAAAREAEAKKSQPKKSQPKKSQPRKSQPKKSPAKKSPAKKSPAKKSPAKKSPTKKSPTKKSPTRKSPTRKSPTKKSPAKKSPTKKNTTKKAPAKRTTTPKRRTNTRTKAPAKRNQGKPAPKKTTTRKPTTKKPTSRSPTRKPTAKTPSKKPTSKVSPPRRAAAPKKAAPAPKKAAAPKAAAPKKAVAPAPAKNQKRKRDLEEFEDEILNRRDFEVVERDGDMNLVERGQYSTFDLVTRNEDGEIVTRECEMYNGDVSCM